MIDGRVVAASAAGRKSEDPTRIHRNDRFLIGSVSKPFTSTLVGVLVEKGVMKFDDTLETMFPEFAEMMHSRPERTDRLAGSTTRLIVARELTTRSPETYLLAASGRSTAGNSRRPVDRGI